MNVSPHERRLSPRFSARGKVQVHVPVAPGANPSEPVQAVLLDLSLNGVQLELDAGHGLVSGALVSVELAIEGTPHVLAKAKLAHLQGDRCGVEFSDMQPHDFDVFAALVLLLEQRIRAQALLA